MSFSVVRRLSTTSQNLFKVTVLGAAGRVGQPLSLLLKRNPLISNLALYDVNKIVKGVACDASHCDTKTMVYGYCGENICKALMGSNIVIIIAGHSHKHGKNKEEQFKLNAEIVRILTEYIIRFSSSALVAVVTSPVNSIVPMVSQLMEKSSTTYDPQKVFGVTTLHLLRAAKFASEYNFSNPKRQFVPVIGGNCHDTIIPLLSRASPAVNESVRQEITKRIHYADLEVLNTKVAAEVALSTAYATARFTNSLLRGLKGGSRVIDYAYVRSNVCPEIPYFAGPIGLGQSGAVGALPYGTVSPFECDLITCAIPHLHNDINIGISYVNKLLQF